MRHSLTLPAVAVTALSAVLLAGCTAGPPTASPTGPVTAFLESLGGGYGDQEAYEEQHRRAQEVVAACMTELGFVYVPTAPVKDVYRGPDGSAQWESREFAEQYGYGVTTSGELYDEEEQVDPNDDYVAAMSEAEQTAYYEALYGPAEEVDPEEAEPEDDGERAGCYGRAAHEVYTENQIWEDPTVQAFLDELDVAWADLADDPGLRAARTAWTTCMVDAGYDFTSPEEASQHIHDRLAALYEAAAAPSGTSEEEPDSGTSEPDAAAMAELRQEELALATAAWRCRDTTGYDAASRKARFELETRLWDRYGAQLEAAASGATSTAG
ncbi:hypothetical protein [Cellulomonas phragmiteti]|uniref:Uncharacterized protein n=1 Tax=Cellulomonas phragmiteti TaxID=478780 RepID=A0ABQ4DIG1_9CELL|nr:hypothetical protein [Cellulomonas phragmiteti]GIG39134.1 hypothetical protein Cph01nite_08960 [Cellulomonas phragmiteti]